MPSATATLDTIVNSGGSPLLNWTHNAFLDSSGVFSAASISYIVQRKWAYDTGYVTIATLSSSATSYKDEQVLISYFSDVFSYRIVSRINYSGNYVYSVPSNKKDVRGELLKPASTAEGKNLPTETKLFDNFPNPFNPSTQIRFDISQPDHVSLKVYDILGREVKTLVNERLDAGGYQKPFDASNLSSGVFFCTLKAGSYSKTMKLVVTK